MSQYNSSEKSALALETDRQEHDTLGRNGYAGYAEQLSKAEAARAAEAANPGSVFVNRKRGPHQRHPLKD